jgi:hypothetical protein
MTKGKDAPLSVTVGYGLNTFYEGCVVTVAVNGTRAIELGNGCAGLSSNNYWQGADLLTEILVNRDIPTFTQLVSLQKE